MTEPNPPSNNHRGYHIIAHSLIVKKKDKATQDGSSPPTTTERTSNPPIIVHGHRIIGTDTALSPKIQKKNDNQVTQLTNYIQNNKVSMADTLSSLLKNHKFVFTGESHIPGLTAYRDIANSFARLKREAEARGEKLVIAVELPTQHQDAAIKAPVDALERLVASDPNDTFYNRWQILFAARRAGLEVHCVDPGIPGFTPERIQRGEFPTTEQHNQRDRQLFTNVTGLSGPKTRVLYYGGTNHGSTTAIPMPQNQRWITVAQLIAESENYGRDSVASIGMVNRQRGLDGHPQFISNTPPVGEVWPHTNGTAVIQLNENSPFKFDQRGTYNYVVIDSGPEPRRN